MKRAFKFRSLLLISVFLMGFLSVYGGPGLEIKTDLLKKLEEPCVSISDIKSTLLQLHALARSEYLSIENNPAYKNKFPDQFVPHRRVFKAEDLFLTCLLENYSNHLDLADGHIAECLKCCEEAPNVSFLTADTLYITNKLIEARIRNRISGAIG